MRLLFPLPVSFLFAVSVSAQSGAAATLTASTSTAPSSTSLRTATTSSTRTSATGTSATAESTPVTHRINVGQGGHSFSNNSLSAAVGDIVQFVFYQTNHSVIRGEYFEGKDCPNNACNPCIPYETIHGPSDLALFSGNQLVTNTPSSTTVQSTDKVWNYTVTNSTVPVWYYCNAIGSCTPNGMVGVINPLEGQSIEKQIAAAKNAAYQLAPGEALPVEGASTTSTSISTPSATATTQPAAHGSRLSGGAIAGIVVGGIAVLALAAALFYFMGRSKTYKDMFKASRGGSDHPGGMSETGPNDRVGPWIANPNSTPTAPYQDNPSFSQGSQAGYQDHRISQMTYSSMAPSHSGTFVGYNRNTGEPEFATEVLGDTGGAVYSANSSPAQKQAGWAAPPSTAFQPATTPIPEARVHEAPGDTPRRSRRS